MTKRCGWILNDSLRSTKVTVQETFVFIHSFITLLLRQARHSHHHHHHRGSSCHDDENRKKHVFWFIRFCLRLQQGNRVFCLFASKLSVDIDSLTTKISIERLANGEMFLCVRNDITRREQLKSYFRYFEIKGVKKPIKVFFSQNQNVLIYV